MQFMYVTLYSCLQVQGCEFGAMALQIASGTLDLTPRLKILAPWPCRAVASSYIIIMLKFSGLIRVNMVNVDEL